MCYAKQRIAGISGFWEHTVKEPDVVSALVSEISVRIAHVTGIVCNLK